MPDKRRWIIPILVVFGAAFLGLLIFFPSKSTDPGSGPVYRVQGETTPTPFPLPTRVYKPQPKVISIIRQLFQQEQPFPEPEQVESQYQLLDDGRYLQLYLQPGVEPPDLVWWRGEAEKVVDSVSRRVGTELDGKVMVLLAPADTGNCAPRGASYQSEPPLVVLYREAGISQEKTLAVLAHELGHILLRQRYGEIDDLALNEGLATWAAGPYWWAWKGAGFDSATLDYYERGVYLPLYQNYRLEKAFDEGSTECLVHRDMLLTELASFLDYLMRTYGGEKLADLLHSPTTEMVDGQTVSYPPDFYGIYGLELNQLENQWLFSLMQD